ncbi:MAG: hypothetical protein ACRDCE_04655 [Cetobacterium sp.]|uniref:hypothetical protein n=1 Tax=Cetobacterium sp. TaxID=2071632 RepID=UPI003EE76E62
MKIIDTESLLVEAHNVKQRNNPPGCGKVAIEKKQVFSFKCYSETTEKIENFAKKHGLTKTQVIEALAEFIPD